MDKIKLVCCRKYIDIFETEGFQRGLLRIYNENFHNLNFALFLFTYCIICQLFVIFSIHKP